MLKQIKEFSSSKLFYLILKDHKSLSLFGAVLFTNALAACMEGGSFGLILMALTALSDSALPSLPFNSFAFLEKIFQGFNKTSLFTTLIILALALQVFRSALNYLGQLFMIGFSTRLQRSTQLSIFQQIFRFSFPFVSKYKVGDLMEYAKTPETSLNIFMDALNRVLVNFFMTFALIFFMCSLSLKLTLFSFVLFGFFAVMQKKFMQKIARRSTVFSKALVELSKTAIQYIQGLRTIHTFGRQKSVLQSIEGMLNSSAKSAKKLQICNQCVGPANEVLGMVLTCTVLVVGPYFLKDRTDLILATLLTFLTLTYRLSSRLQIIMSNISTMMTNVGQISRLNEILCDQDKEFVEDGPDTLTSFKEQIEFNEVSLAYDPSHHPSLSNICFKIPQGKMIAFVGASGAGKSSLIDLLIKLYSPTKGSIFVDGRPLKSIENSSWRALLGVVSQDAIIFNDTIEENIRFGMKNTSIQEVIEAAKIAQAHEFINKLPQGYKTELGERGYRLSGGERQRLTFARAILRKPQILILDEATSNLDSSSELLIQKALQTYRLDKTVLVIAHRLSTVVDADQIIVLDRGSIIERGSHTELIALNGAYASLWNIQTAGKDQEELCIINSI